MNMRPAPSIGDAINCIAKSVTFPLFTDRFHPPVRMTLNAFVILKSDSGTVITRELIGPVAEKVEVVLFSRVASSSSELEEVGEWVI